MKYATTLMLLLGCLSLSACSEDNVDLVDTTENSENADASDTANVREGGPETDRTETRYESAVPEWEEAESGEVADGDQ